MLVVSQLRVIVRRKFVQEKCSEEYLAFFPLNFWHVLYALNSHQHSIWCSLWVDFRGRGLGQQGSFPSDLWWQPSPWPFTGTRPGDSRRSPRFPFSELLERTWQRRLWHPTPILLPGKSHGRRSLVGCSPWGHQESDTTERLHFPFSLSCIGEGNGNPLQCSCLENPRDGGASWAAACGVTQRWTWLKRLSSSRKDLEHALSSQQR